MIGCGTDCWVSLFLHRLQEKNHRGCTKLNFSCLSPDLITAAQWLLLQHFTFGVRHALTFLSYSQHSNIHVYIYIYIYIYLKYSSLCCWLGCSPLGTLLVGGGCSFFALVCKENKNNSCQGFHSLQLWRHDLTEQNRLSVRETQLRVELSPRRNWSSDVRLISFTENTHCVVGEK